jgi:6-pyruvoyltetrahydropterin/6-carboxytetrahydropterin synthase
MPHLYEIRIRKEALKFSSSHMTVFPDGTKESLHGHQFMPTVSIKTTQADLQNMIPFADIKREMKRIALEWDEKVLIGVLNPHYRELTRTSSEIEFLLCGKRYLLPLDEVVFLQCDNVTCEQLARIYHSRLKEGWGSVPPHVISVSVLIEESPGQGAVFSDD